ncbi:hypothetical protein M427DRAFT_153731 [Gonapodya prolifera JEL478]|uniref:RING-type domain-containing protein n=1 Tax=Gonapodya prolifera (strain JEL478) TaxID=1344416 RepID=A0A139AL52_GONPJ|nr:hypothetical protein M427DRAFT_153731 [Gonapodya prolifera JEL478]|eukprot:KXS17519.1 hypothetical protein M427DRAFT_153731 [Gonapodya prolifera JEL478]
MKLRERSANRTPAHPPPNQQQSLRHSPRKKLRSSRTRSSHSSSPPPPPNPPSATPPPSASTSTSTSTSTTTNPRPVVWEEYTWAGVTRIRATALLEGGLAAHGFVTSSSSSASASRRGSKRPRTNTSSSAPTSPTLSEDDEDEPLVDVDGDIDGADDDATAAHRISEQDVLDYVQRKMKEQKEWEDSQSGLAGQSALATEGERSSWTGSTSTGSGSGWTASGGTGVSGWSGHIGQNGQSAPSLQSLQSSENGHFGPTGHYEHPGHTSHSADTPHSIHAHTDQSDQEGDSSHASPHLTYQHPHGDPDPSSTQSRPPPSDDYTPVSLADEAAYYADDDTPLENGLPHTPNTLTLITEGVSAPTQSDSIYSFRALYPPPQADRGALREPELAGTAPAHGPNSSSGDASAGSMPGASKSHPLAPIQSAQNPAPLDPRTLAALYRLASLPLAVAAVDPSFAPLSSSLLHPSPNFPNTTTPTPTPLLSALLGHITHLTSQLSRAPKCLVCLDVPTYPHAPPCNHALCRECWLGVLATRRVCPICNRIVGAGECRRVWLG